VPFVSDFHPTLRPMRELSSQTLFLHRVAIHVTAGSPVPFASTTGAARRGKLA
jgi:hypothetical protein